uniref:Uncharacterized protein n=1 Tax=Hordeum vulgare subsp. vulgare TaxID=112509 RepID=A0A8I6YS13_HORVV
MHRILSLSNHVDVLVEVVFFKVSSRKHALPIFITTYLIMQADGLLFTSKFHAILLSSNDGPWRAALKQCCSVAKHVLLVFFRSYTFYS